VACYRVLMSHDCHIHSTSESSASFTCYVEELSYSERIFLDMPIAVKLSTLLSLLSILHSQAADTSHVVSLCVTQFLFVNSRLLILSSALHFTSILPRWLSRPIIQVTKAWNLWTKNRILGDRFQVKGQPEIVINQSNSKRYPGKQLLCNTWNKKMTQWMVSVYVKENFFWILMYFTFHALREKNRQKKLSECLPLHS
jgi:hypothetical protein